MERRVRPRRYFEFSRTTRYRIRRALQNFAHRDLNPNTSDSSDEDALPYRHQIQPPRRRRRMDAESSSSSSTSDFPSGEDSPDGAAGNVTDVAVSTDNGNSEVPSEQEDDSVSGLGSNGSDHNQDDNSSAAEHSSEDEGRLGDDQDMDGDLSGGDVARNSVEELSDDDVELPGEGEPWDPDNDITIYNLAPISLGESMYAILNFFLRHNLSVAALSDLLTLIDLHCRVEDNQMPKTVHHFRNFFANLQFPTRKHYYCSVCFQTVANPGGMCENCDQQQQLNYFIQIPIIPQLQALFSRPGFREKLQHRNARRKFVDENLEDMYDGAFYRELAQDGEILSNPMNLSLTWYTDGVSIFKTAKYEIWPFYLVINELPFNDRTRVSNAILAGVWFGREKPVPITFLRPISDELLRLREGVDFRIGNPVRVVQIKAVVLSGTADLPAKAKFLNIKNFNSMYGCPKCKIRSENIRRGLNIYRFIRQLDLRTDVETIQHATAALNLPQLNGQRQDVLGVKGPTMVATFMRRFMTATSVDEMHAVFLGLVKCILMLLFDSKFHDQEFSLSNQKRLVNTRLKAICPPGFAQRLTRTLEDSKYWRAHELKTFLFYYSIPVLCDLLPQLYLDHHKLLVLGMYLLNQRSISQGDIDLASELLTEYVSQFEDLYGEEHLTCNLHQLLHLPQTVKDLGPLWVTSCFPFEDLNGKLKKLVKGTSYAELQVCSGVSMLIKLAELKDSVPRDSRAYDFAEKMFDPNLRHKLTVIGNKTSIVGKSQQLHPVPQLVEQALNRANINGRILYEFYRLKKYSIIYGSDAYDRALKKKSSCVRFKWREDEYLGFINRFVCVSDCACEVLCNDCPVRYFAIIQICETRVDFEAWEGAELNFIRTLIEGGGAVAVEVADIVEMCYVVGIVDRDITYIVTPVNMIEAE